MYPLGTWFVSGICVWIPRIKKTTMMIMIIIIIIIIINIIQSVDIRSIPRTVIVFVTFGTNKIPHIMCEYPNQIFNSHYSVITAIKSTAKYKFHPHFILLFSVLLHYFNNKFKFSEAPK
jgi:hypothetical protein